MQLCMRVHQNERVLVSTYVRAVHVSLLGPCQEGSGSGVPVRVCERGHAYDVCMGMDMPITMCMDMRVYVCVRMDARACS